MIQDNAKHYEKIYKIINENKESLKGIILDALTYVDLEHLGMGLFYDEALRQNDFIIFDMSEDDQRYEMVSKVPQLQVVRNRGMCVDYMPVIVQFYIDPSNPETGGHFTSMVLLNRETYLEDTKPVQELMMRNL